MNCVAQYFQIIIIARLLRNLCNIDNYILRIEKMSAIHSKFKGRFRRSTRHRDEVIYESDSEDIWYLRTKLELSSPTTSHLGYHNGSERGVASLIDFIRFYELNDSLFCRRSSSTKLNRFRFIYRNMILVIFVRKRNWKCLYHLCFIFEYQSSTLIKRIHI